MDPVTPPPVTGIVPHLNVDGAAAAADFYVRAFGALELFRLQEQNGERLLHCHLTINGSPLFLADLFPEVSPEGHGAAFEPSNSHTLHVAVADCDAATARAVEAGATVTSPPADMFWGDRYARLRDPFGINWSIGSPAKA